MANGVINNLFHRSTDDADYVALQLNTGFSGGMRIKRDGNLVTLLFAVSSGLATTFQFIVDSVPEKYRPVGNINFPIVNTNRLVGFGQIEVTAAGVKIGASSEGPAGYACISYLVR